MPNVHSGYQALTRPAERRMGMDLLRRINELEARAEAAEASLLAVQAELQASGMVVARSTAAGNTTSATFVSWPTSTPLATSFHKFSATSAIVIDLSAMCFILAGGFIVDFGVNVNSADHLIMDAAINTSSVHESYSGKIAITGLAAGVWTFTLRARVGGSTLHCDANDTQVWTIQEVPRYAVP